MDPICHTLVGATLSQAGLGRKTAGGAAALIIGANLPDIDGVAMLMGQDTALWIRRGWTHGAPALVALPLVLAGILMAWHRLFAKGAPAPLRPLALVSLSYLGVLTHPTLDWMNQYGMRWLMPIDGTWYYGDSIFIVDPWLWLVLGSAVFLASSRRPASVAAWALFAVFAGSLLFSIPGLLAAKVVWILGVVLVAGLRRGGAAEPSRARALALAAVAAGTAYILTVNGVAAYGRSRVTAELESRGLMVEALMVAALPITPFDKQVVVRTPEGYRVGTAHLLPRFELALEPGRLPLPDAIVETALDDPSIRGFANWARFPYGEVERDGADYVVYLLDARYASRRSSGFGTARVTLPASSVEDF